MTECEEVGVKVFSLAGYKDQPEVKAQLEEKVRRLGGEVETGAWSERVTHVLTNQFQHYQEKVMLGLVTGSWVVTKRFLDKSSARGSWANPKAYVCDDLVMRHRQRLRTSGKLFEGLRVALVLRNSLQNKVYTRIVTAGGGHVLPVTSLGQLCRTWRELSLETLDFVVIDDTTHDHWEEWKGILKLSTNLKLRHIQYKYFFLCITQCRRVDISDFLVDKSEKTENHKRQSGDSSSSEQLKKMRRTEPEVVTLESDEDSDDEDDIQILEQKLFSRKPENLRRVYIEKSSNLNTSCEVIDLGDTDDENVPKECYNSAGLSSGLKQAISKLQQKPRPFIRKSNSPEKKKLLSPALSSANIPRQDDEDEEDIEVLDEKKASEDNKSRSSQVLDRKAIMFQTGLRNLLNQNADDKSQSSVEEEARTEAGSVEAVEVPSPTHLFPSLSLERWGEAEDPLARVCLVLDCVLERQHLTGECITVGLVSSRTNKYLKREGGRAGSPQQVDSSVREEFAQKYSDLASGEEDQSLSSQINQASNILSSLKFLQCYTGHLSHPTPAIINSLLMSCLLGNQSRMVVEKTVDYLEVAVYRFLSCVSSNVITYTAWLELILSSCRTVNITQLSSFSLQDKRDTVACQAFFKLLVREFSSDSPEPGAVLLAEFLVGLCQRDLQLWWRSQKNDRDSYPVLYYLLGDSSTSLVSTVKTVLAPVYSHLLSAPYSERLGLVRRLLTMSGILLSHLDTVNKQSYINTGSKLELAGLVAGVMAEWYRETQSGQSLWCELMLLQPDWFSLLVARQLLSLLTSSRVKVSSLTDLTAALARLSVEEREGGVGRCVDILQYRAVSCCHLHTILRTVWDSSNSSNSVFNMINRLDKTQEKTYKDKSKTKIVKFRSGVTFRMTSIVDDLNLLAEFVHGLRRVECHSKTMEIEKNVLTDDSDTDYDCDEDSSSSDDEENFVRKIGNITTKTSSQGKIKIREALQAGPREEEEMDDFEAEMESELDARVLEAETKAAIANTEALAEPTGDFPANDEDLGLSEMPSTSGTSGDRYSDIYFDSDEEDSDQRKVVSNDELFYDPQQDDEDQSWVDSVRKSYQVPRAAGTVSKLPNSDAVLNCPACFTVLCLDCQRHEIYKTQYRAMFVINCSVNTNQKMSFPLKNKKGGRMKKTVTEETYHPVTCDTCNTEVAMYDKDEIYHFFNVVASHS